MTPRLNSVIPLVDLRAQYASIKDEVDSAIRRVLDSSSFILGGEVSSFEDEFARYLGVRYVVGTASGTAALFLALAACGVGRGYEVITSPLTFTATAEAICHAGATPVFVDVDPLTLNIDPAKVEAAITPRTRAIVPVHLYGNPCDMDSIMELARRYGLIVVEDAAQAHGATYKGRYAGTIGHVGCFSFYPGKNLGAYGDAGAVATDDPDIAAKVRRLRDHGRVTKYEHLEVGYGERLDALQAAVLRAKLPHLTEWNRLRRAWASEYRSRLAGLPVRFVEETPGGEPVYHIFAVRTGNQDGLVRFLRQNGIQAGIHYPIPLHLQPAYRHLGYSEGAFPVAEEAARTEVSLPLYPELGLERLERVVGAVREFLLDGPRAYSGLRLPRSAQRR